MQLNKMSFTFVVLASYKSVFRLFPPGIKTSQIFLSGSADRSPGDFLFLLKGPLDLKSSPEPRSTPSFQKSSAGDGIRLPKTFCCSSAMSLRMSAMSSKRKSNDPGGPWAGQHTRCHLMLLQCIMGFKQSSAFSPYWKLMEVILADVLVTSCTCNMYIMLLCLMLVHEY